MIIRVERLWKITVFLLIFSVLFLQATAGYPTDEPLATMNTTGNITVVTPDGGETWQQGSPATIRWNYTGDPGSHVKIDILKGPTVLLNITSASIGTGGSGSFTLMIPYNIPVGSDYTIRVTSTSNPACTDTSNAPFTIGSAITVTSPNGGEDWPGGSTQTIRWTYHGLPGSHVKIDLLKGPTILTNITASTPIGSEGTGSFSWQVPSDIPPDSDYRIRVSSTSYPNCNDTSETYFSIYTQLPDFADEGPTWLFMDKSAYKPGEAFSAHSHVVNYGPANSSGNYWVAFYLSTDSSITSDDYLLGSDYIGDSYPVHPAGSWVPADISGTIPSGITGGMYYLGVMIDPENLVTEGFETNNTGVDDVPIDISPDTDHDGIADEEDNCPLIANTDQLDTDSDGMGDVCDPDDDNDTIADEEDNCPLIANTDQLDTDSDGMGDVCDPDDDNDTIADDEDNCPLIANTDQLDNDGDGIGNVCDKDPSITVMSPNGGEDWQQGTVQTIRWSYLGDPGAKVNIEVLKGTAILKTLTGISIGSSGSGSYNVTIPASTPLGSNYTIRVTSASDPEYTDTSDGPFTIAGPSILVTVPNGGETFHVGSTLPMNWTYHGYPGSTVNIEVIKGAAILKTLTGIPIGSSGSGSYSVTIPASTPLGTDYKIRVTSASTPTCTDTSNGSFAIGVETSSSITVQVPNSGENWVQGSLHTLRWTYTGNPGTMVKIEALRGETVLAVITPGTPLGSGGSGSFDLTFPYNTPLASDYRIRVTSTTNPGYTDTSDYPFTISSAITVATPNGGEDYKIGSTLPMSWTYTGTPGSLVNIDVTKGGAILKTLTGIPIGSGGSGSYNVTIPAGTPLGPDYTIRVTSGSYAACTDTSNGTFAISAS